MGKHLKSPNNGTPDERGAGPSRLDRAEHGTIGHDMKPVVRGATKITSSPMGRADPMDKPTHNMQTNAEASLGAGGGRLGDAASSIKSGARTACVDWGVVKRG
jgi:hypothetical protein